MIRTIIITQSTSTCLLLKQLLAQCAPYCVITAEPTSHEEAINVLQRQSCDLVFAEVRTPDGYGLDLLKKLSPSGPIVVLICAMDTYALQAYEFNTAYYLLKPIEGEAVKRAMEKVVRLMPATPPAEPHIVIRPKVTLPCADGTSFVDLQQIVRVTSYRNYSTFSLNDGSKITVSRPLGYYETSLTSQCFCRVHRSHIINMTHVGYWKKGAGESISLSDGSKVPLSHRCREAFVAALDRCHISDSPSQPGGTLGLPIGEYT